MAGAPNIYGSEGSVPYQPSVAPTGAPNAKVTTQASPADFGAAVGQGIEKVGGAATNLANEYGGMVNNTLANTAESNLAQKIGKIKGDYMSKTGMDAYNSYGAYQAAVEQAYQDNKQGLTLGAQQAYMTNTRRIVDNHLADGSSYAATQLKDASVYSDTQVRDVHIQSALDPNVATNPRKMGEAEGNITHLTGSTIDQAHPGLKTDPDTGTVSFDESKPEGQQLKAQFQQNLDSAVSQLRMNQFSALARPDVMGAIPAYNYFNQIKDTLPPQAQVGIESYLKPRVFQDEVTNGTNSVINEAKQAHAQMLYNPQAEQPLSVRNNNPGNLRDQTTGAFRTFNTPEEGAAAMQADLTAKVSGNSPAMERNFGKGYSPTLSNVITTYAPAADKNDPKAYTDSVSKETGIAPNQVLTVADIPKLQAAMTKVEGGGTPSGAATQPAPKYGVNANGAPLTEADYYQAHSGDVLARWHDIAQQNWPGDLAHEKAGEATLRQYMQTAIQNQTGQERQNKQSLMTAVLGDGSPNAKTITSLPQLLADPKLKSLYMDMASRDSHFTEMLNTMMVKTTRADANQNSPNAYDAIQGALNTSKSYSRQEQIEYLSKGLGSDNPGYSISQKDFNDAKPAIDLDNGKDVLSATMKQIAQANGNLDGKGQERAVQWYNQTMAAWKANQATDKPMDEATFFDKEKGAMPPVNSPSRIEQLQTVAAEKAKQAAPTFTDKAQYEAAPSGTIYIRDGQQYRKP